MQAMAGGAEVVFWGSAYGGGNPLRSAAMMHNYAIVSSGCKTHDHCWRLGCILPRALAGASNNRAGRDHGPGQPGAQERLRIVQ